MCKRKWKPPGYTPCIIDKGNFFVRLIIMLVNTNSLNQQYKLFEYYYCDILDQIFNKILEAINK